MHVILLFAQSICDESEGRQSKTSVIGPNQLWYHLFWVILYKCLMSKLSFFLLGIINHNLMIESKILMTLPGNELIMIQSYF